MSIPNVCISCHISKSAITKEIELRRDKHGPWIAEAARLARREKRIEIHTVPVQVPIRQWEGFIVG